MKKNRRIHSSSIQRIQKKENPLIKGVVITTKKIMILNIFQRFGVHSVGNPFGLMV
jgi:hypothetical protein